jgi:hypothetical protein
MEIAERDMTETTGAPDPAPLTDRSGETPAPPSPIAVTIEVSREEIEPPTVIYQSVTEWRGTELVDRDGETIGKLERVYFDVETDEPQFATVKEGFIGRPLTFVPLSGGADSIQVTVSRNQVKDAPTIQQDGDGLSSADESALYHHFELNYTPTATATGQRLARRH